MSYLLMIIFFFFHIVEGPPNGAAPKVADRASFLCGSPILARFSIDK